MIKCQEEQFGTLLTEIKPLFKQHWEELANNKDIRALDPDYDAYIQLNNMGIIRIFTVRDDDRLIGYAFFLVAKNLHYKTWKYAVSDIYYLLPEFRKTEVSTRMFTEMETWLRFMGVKSVTIQDKINHSHTNFFVKLGFKPIEQLYEKIF